jgi:hypothetical protein
MVAMVAMFATEASVFGSSEAVVAKIAVATSAKLRRFVK